MFSWVYLVMFYWVVLSCEFFCVIWFCLLLRYPSGWLERLYSSDIVCIEGFPLQSQIEELCIVMVYYCMFSQNVTLSTFSLISLLKLQHTFQRHDYRLLELKVPLNFSQSIYHLWLGPESVFSTWRVNVCLWWLVVGVFCSSLDGRKISGVETRQRR